MFLGSEALVPPDSDTRLRKSRTPCMLISRAIRNHVCTAQQDFKSNDLFVDTSLSVMIRILHGVQSVQEASLLGASGSGGGVVVVVTISVAGRGTGCGSSCSASGTGSRSSKPAVNSSWLSLESVVTFLASGEASSLLFEVGHADGWEGGGGVVLSFVDVGFVDGNGGVDNGGLDGLLLDNGLDGLVYVVVDMLAGNDGSH